MGEDLIRYDIVVQNALRRAVRDVLTVAANDGLPGEHHFYITFLTQAPGVKLSQKIRAQYPEEMTVVLQHQFWDLQAEADYFEVKLSFNNKTEHLVIPYTAIRSFIDPSVEFALQFGQQEGEPAVTPNTPPPVLETETPLPFAPVTGAEEPAGKMAGKPQQPETSADGEEADEEAGQAEIVQLDAFRKKN